VRVEQSMRYGWLVVAVGLAVAAYASDAQAKLDVYVDKSNQRITVVRDGYVRYVWPVSTARDSYAPPNGVYTDPRLERSNSPMPYTISFHEGYAMHGSYDLTNLSGPASHGSIRLYPQHVATLFAMVEQEGAGNTTITIAGDDQPTPQARQSRSMAGEVLRSASLGDGGFGKGAYPPLPRPAPNKAMNQSQPGADASQGAAHRMPEPRSKPHGEMGRNADASARQIDAADQYTTPDVYRTQDRWTPGFGYQVLPKSYWTGGSWRWWNTGQEAP
jgi:L,D-transpeptidase catalytic domain